MARKKTKLNLYFEMASLRTNPFPVDIFRIIFPFQEQKFQFFASEQKNYLKLVMRSAKSGKK